jgi:Flp pilus assembly protein TadG
VKDFFHNPGSSALFTRLRTHDRASQVAEFALSVPLLVVFVVGIYDFSGAIALKQKLTNAAREAARVAAADPSNDVSAPASTSTMPVSISDARQVVDNYLLSEQLNDCGLSSSSPAQSSSVIWTFTANGCAPTSFTLTINRGYFLSPSATAAAPANCMSVPVGAASQAVIATCVTIQYPYVWKFSSVSGFFAGSFLGPSTITTTSVMFNEN